MRSLPNMLMGAGTVNGLPVSLCPSVLIRGRETGWAQPKIAEETDVAGQAGGQGSPLSAVSSAAAPIGPAKDLHLI